MAGIAYPEASLDDVPYGVGLDAELDTDVLKLGKTGIRIDQAHPTGSYAATNVEGDTFYVQLLRTFWRRATRSIGPRARFPWMAARGAFGDGLGAEVASLPCGPPLLYD